ncbi:DUF2753 family protein [Shewanella pneumatophori]|uniref:DUF2753 domain-containing protein n=1 Tax=Shewanella pneumatophori TaxID=314092 RepID=A0A9X1ZD75_9GAMM|nr:DUF2753 family protein [Shewanella pneumatophori]MCL1138852.1 DUF2753 domain-containing protein [Shewanella pneumatophori]
MENWQQLMTSGNQHFKEASWMDAQYCYQQAVAMIENQWSHQVSDRELLFAWVAGMHNLAHLNECQDKTEVALYYLKNAHQEVQSLSNNESVADEVRSCAFQSLSLTIPPLLEFAKRHPICDDCISALEQTAEQIGMKQTPLH